MNTIKVIKKNGQKVNFDCNKIKVAIRKSAERVLVKLTRYEEDQVCLYTIEQINELGFEEVSVSMLHKLVELSLDKVNKEVAKSYREYRNYKTDFVAMLDEAYKKSLKIMFLGDKENSNTDSALVATKRVLSYNEINKLIYKKFFLTPDELEAIEDGYIYIHDMNARRDTYNCCLFNVGNVMKGGFELGNLWYNEPTNIDKALDILGDLINAKAGQQYGGLTISCVDEVLAPYLEKTHLLYKQQLLEEAKNLFKVTNITDELLESIDKTALEKAIKDLEDGLQGIEYKANSIGSSRGDFPFITFAFGNSTNKYALLVSSAILKVRKNGQGKKGKKKCVLFPKLIFQYNEEQHGEGKEFEWLFDEAVECSSKAMYPDFLSLTGEGYIPSIFKKYGKIIDLMGCRASLSPWFERGGMKPADDDDVPVFNGRFNIGACSTNLIMIYQKAKEEGKDFYEVLDYYLEMIRGIHIRTYEYLGEMKASMDPLAFCEGGFYCGNLGLNDKIKPLLKYATASFGITALDELQYLHNQKTLFQDNTFAKEVMEYINKKVEEYKWEDGNLYAIYGTPAESLCYTQVKQFRKKYGIIEGVSERDYVSNSFHCNVREDINPIQKQDRENELYNYFNGGKITYCKYPNGYNIEAIKTIVRRAMGIGLYQGVNLSLQFCDDCGLQTTTATKECECCGSDNLVNIDRMNGYLSYSRVKNDTRLNEGKMAEIADRVSM